MSVDALSSTLGATNSFDYDYEQFVRDDGRESTASNDRPWQVIADGLQNRYTAADDHFTVDVALQYAKGFTTDSLSVVSGTDRHDTAPAAIGGGEARSLVRLIGARGQMVATEPESTR